MDIATLSKRRAQCLAELEAVDGWEFSGDLKERGLYARARRAYVKAEDDFQRAISTLMPEEVAAAMERKPAA